MQSRGKALLNALNSLQQLDKALDRFLAWLSETESALELLETEEEKYGPRNDFHRSHGCHEQIRVCVACLAQFHFSYHLEIETTYIRCFTTYLGQFDLKM